MSCRTLHPRSISLDKSASLSSRSFPQPAIYLHLAPSVPPQQPLQLLLDAATHLLAAWLPCRLTAWIPRASPAVPHAVSSPWSQRLEVRSSFRRRRVDDSAMRSPHPSAPLSPARIQLVDSRAGVRPSTQIKGDRRNFMQADSWLILSRRLVDSWTQRQLASGYQQHMLRCGGQGIAGPRRSPGARLLPRWCR